MMSTSANDRESRFTAIDASIARSLANADAGRVKPASGV
jgi:predicted transcriptional regulator